MPFSLPRALYHPWLYNLLRILLGALFVWSGAIKLADPPAFAAVVSQYNLVPDPLLVPVAIGLPLLELIAGIAAIFDKKGALEAIFAMLGLFLFVLWFGILHNLDIDCGCFSTSETETHNSLKTAFYRDWALLACVIYLWFCRRRRTQTDIRRTP